jgi:hypothetical protein
MKPWRQGAKTTAEEIHNTLDPAACENIQRRFLGALLEGYRDYVLHIHTSQYTSKSSQEWSPARGEAWALGQEMAQDDFCRAKGEPDVPTPLEVKNTKPTEDVQNQPAAIVEPPSLVRYESPAVITTLAP